MSGIRQQALQDARRLLRSFASAPDARRRAQEVISELRRAQGLPPALTREIASLEAWLRSGPSVVALEPRLRALLSKIG